MDMTYKALLDRAQEILQNRGDINEARNILNALLTDHVDDTEHSFYLTYLLGSVELLADNAGLAITLFKQAVSLKPDFVEARCNIGYLYKKIGKREQSAQAFESLWPYINDEKFGMASKERSEYISNIASAYVANGTPLKAIELCNQALALDANNSHAVWNRGLAYLESGDYTQGFEGADSPERLNKYEQRQYLRDQLPFWDGTPGKKVVVFGEQGIGDELMFASMLPDLMRDCEVVLDAHIRLQEMFMHSFPGLHIYGTREGPDVPWAKYEDVDAKLCIGSLGKFYRKRREDFPGTPYLSADPVLVNKHRERLGSLSPRPKVGLSWQGGVIQTNKKVRRIDMEMLLPLFECDVDFISLQYNKGIGKKVRAFEEQHGVCLHHWQDVLDDYDETAGLVCNMDLIISVPQSVVHLAGGLGRPTLQLCPKRALWQMGPYGEDMPWYSCVQNIWQEQDGDWDLVIQKAKEKLCSLLQKSTEN